MSDEKRPREAWITRHEGSGDADKLTHIALFEYYADQNPMRFIEFSEVERLKAENERLALEVVKRNQYKINEKYLDNVHKHYESEITTLKSRLEIAVEALENYDKYPSPSDQVCCNNAVQVGEQEWSCCGEPITAAAQALANYKKEIE